jgi:hypothetical protein
MAKATKVDRSHDTRLAAREFQVAVLRARLSDCVAQVQTAVADAASHAREAAAQRERAERAETEARGQRARAEARDAELETAQMALGAAHRQLARLRTRPLLRVGRALRRRWGRAS